MGPCCFPGSFKTIGFLVDGIVPNGGDYRNFESTLSREIAEPPCKHGFYSTLIRYPQADYAPVDYLFQLPGD
jgi:hypothetical protein